MVFKILFNRYDRRSKNTCVHFQAVGMYTVKYNLVHRPCILYVIDVEELLES